MLTEAKQIKCVVVGDKAAEKNRFLATFIQNEFPETYIPTVFDSHIANLTVGARPVELGLWSTSGQEEYDRLRPLSYSSTDVFILLFDVTRPVSFENAKVKWLKELRHFAPDAKILLVGDRIDLQDDPGTLSKLAALGQSCVTEAEIAAFANKQGIAYSLCSSKTGKNFTDVFNETVNMVLLNYNNAGEKAGLAKQETKKARLQSKIERGKERRQLRIERNTRLIAKIKQFFGIKPPPESKSSAVTAVLNVLKTPEISPYNIAIFSNLISNGLLLSSKLDKKTLLNACCQQIEQTKKTKLPIYPALKKLVSYDNKEIYDMLKAAEAELGYYYIKCLKLLGGFSYEKKYLAELEKFKPKPETKNLAAARPEIKIIENIMHSLVDFYHSCDYYVEKLDALSKRDFLRGLEKLYNQLENVGHHGGFEIVMKLSEMLTQRRHQIESSEQYEKECSELTVNILPALANARQKFETKLGISTGTKKEKLLARVRGSEHTNSARGALLHSLAAQVNKKGGADKVSARARLKPVLKSGAESGTKKTATASKKGLFAGLRPSTGGPSKPTTSEAKPLTELQLRLQRRRKLNGEAVSDDATKVPPVEEKSPSPGSSS